MDASVLGVSASVTRGFTKTLLREQALQAHPHDTLLLRTTVYATYLYRRVGVLADTEAVGCGYIVCLVNFLVILA